MVTLMGGGLGYPLINTAPDGRPGMWDPRAGYTSSYGYGLGAGEASGVALGGLAILGIALSWVLPIGFGYLWGKSKCRR